jgi:hypothetical protein
MQSKLRRLRMRGEVEEKKRRRKEEMKGQREK